MQRNFLKVSSCPLLPSSSPLNPAEPFPSPATFQLQPREPLGSNCIAISTTSAMQQNLGLEAVLVTMDPCHWKVLWGQCTFGSILLEDSTDLGGYCMTPYKGRPLQVIVHQAATNSIQNGGNFWEADWLHYIRENISDHLGVSWEVSNSTTRQWCHTNTPLLMITEVPGSRTYLQTSWGLQRTEVIPGEVDTLGS